MKKTFVRALAVSAIVQFVITRQRAGTVIEEGAAEALWLRYPFAVLGNALVWTLMLATLGRFVRIFRAS